MGVCTRLVPSAVLAISALLLAPQGVQGQEAAPVRKSVLTINPLGIPFEYFSGEFEGLLSGLMTVGLTVSYFGGFDDIDYTTAEAKLRFYPNEEAPKGFSVGLSTGITSVEGDRFDGTGTGTTRERETRPTVGVVVDYNWILGKTKRFLVGAGLGAKRILGSSGDIDDFNIGYPTARFQVGFLF